MKNISNFIVIIYILALGFLVLPLSANAAASDFEPTDLYVCKLADNSSRIYWKTAKSVLTGVTHDTKDPLKKSPFWGAKAETNHYVTFGSLKKGTKYNYNIFKPTGGLSAIDPKSERTYTKSFSEDKTFVAGETNDAEKCKTVDTNQKPPAKQGGTSDPSKPKNIDYKANAPRAVNMETGAIEITNRTGQNDIMGIVAKLINWLLAILAMVAGLMIIYASIIYLTSGGAQDKAAQAKSTLIMAILGLVVSLGAFALVNIIIGLL